MLYLPTYNEVKQYEGTGNFAVKKYYKFPWKFFYRHKLEMIDRMLSSNYYKVLDFGCGKAKIFKEHLQKHCCHVFSVDQENIINPLWRFNLIVCASVMEFVDLKYYTELFERILANNGEIIIASPMDTWISRLYFWIISDKNKRNSHHEIFSAFAIKFKVVEYKTWLGMYFCMKVKKR